MQTAMSENSTTNLTPVTHATASKHDRIHFAIIRFVHETVYGVFVDPYRRLTQAGLGSGQRVLEVGCGPGFFTLPAAKITGEAGFVYALDINPAAIEHVSHKVDREGLRNVKVELADAAESGLPDESVDTAFLFGVVRSLKDVGKVMREMHRVLNKNGTLSVESGLPEKKLLEAVCTNGMFNLREERNRIFVFEKREASKRIE